MCDSCPVIPLENISEHHDTERSKMFGEQDIVMWVWFSGVNNLHSMAASDLQGNIVFRKRQLAECDRKY
jgi:hypothetical protein